MYCKRKDSFTQRIVKLWNSLPQDVVMATHLDGFKRGLDKYLEAKAINGYQWLLALMVVCSLQYSRQEACVHQPGTSYLLMSIITGLDPESAFCRQNGLI